MRKAGVDEELVNGDVANSFRLQYTLSILEPLLMYSIVVNSL